MFRIPPVVLAVLAALGLNGDPRAQVAPARTAGGAERCAQLSSLRLPDVRLAESRYVAADPAASGPVHVAHCRATGVIGTEIGFAVWLPDEWNGRFLMAGGGGYVGSI